MGTITVIIIIAIIVVGLLILAWYLLWHDDPNVQALRDHMQHERDILNAAGDTPTAEQCEEIQRSISELERLMDTVGNKPDVWNPANDLLKALKEYRSTHCGR